MTSVSKRPRGAKIPYDLVLPQFSEEPDAWFKRARATLEDLIAAAEDAVRPLGERQLGRREHVRIIAESGSTLYDLLERLPGGASR